MGLDGGAYNNRSLRPQARLDAPVTRLLNFYGGRCLPSVARALVSPYRPASNSRSFQGSGILRRSLGKLGEEREGSIRRSCCHDRRGWGMERAKEPSIWSTLRRRSCCFALARCTAKLNFLSYLCRRLRDTTAVASALSALCLRCWFASPRCIVLDCRSFRGRRLA